MMIRVESLDLLLRVGDDTFKQQYETHEVLFSDENCILTKHDGFYSIWSTYTGECILGRPGEWKISHDSPHEETWEARTVPFVVEQ